MMFQKKQQASALLLVFWILLLGLGFLAASIQITLIHTNFSGTENRRLQALLNAETGISLAIAKIEKQQQGDGSGDFGEGTYSTTVTDSTSGVKKIVGVGNLSNDMVQITCFYLPSVAMPSYQAKLSLLVPGSLQMIGSESSFIIKIPGPSSITGQDHLEDGTTNPDPSHNTNGIAYAESSPLPSTSLSVQMDSSTILDNSTILDPANYLGSTVDSLVNYARLKHDQKITISGVTEINASLGAPGDYKIIYATGTASAGNVLSYTAEGNSYGLMVIDLTGDGTTLNSPVFSFATSSGTWHGTIIIAFSGSVVFSSPTDGLVSLASSAGGIIGNVVVALREGTSMNLSSGSAMIYLCDANQILYSYISILNALPPGSKLVWRRDL